MISKFIHFIIFIIVFIIQVSFISASPFLRENLNLILTLLFCYLYTVNFRQGLILGLIFGALLDIFSSLPFGIILSAQVVALLIVSVLMKNVFTNRSFLSFFALMITGTTTYYLSLLLLTHLFSLFNQAMSTTGLFQASVQSVIGVATSTLFGILIYYSTNLFMKIIGKRFLISKTISS